MILFIFYLVIPVLALVCGNRIAPAKTAEDWLSHDQTDALRGLAGYLIVAHHLAQRTGTGYPYSLLGYSAVSVFLLLSGYTQQLHSSEHPIDIHWLLKRLYRMLLPFLLLWVGYLLFCAITGYPMTPSVLLADLLCLRLPDTICWYFRVQLLLYLLFWLVFRLSPQKAGPLFRLVLISVLIICYMLAAALTGLPTYWYQTVLMFPVGMALALFRDFKFPVICRLPYLAVFPGIMTAFIILTVWQFGFLLPQFVVNILLMIFFTTFCVLLAGQVKFSSPVLCGLGRCSLELYLLHSLLLCGGAFQGCSLTDPVQLLLFLMISFCGAFLLHRSCTLIRRSVK